MPILERNVFAALGCCDVHDSDLHCMALMHILVFVDAGKRRGVSQVVNSTFQNADRSCEAGQEEGDNGTGIVRGRPQRPAATRTPNDSCTGTSLQTKRRHAHREREDTCAGDDSSTEDAESAIRDLRFILRRRASAFAQSTFAGQRS